MAGLRTLGLPLALVLILPTVISLIGRIIGFLVRRRSNGRRSLLLRRMVEDQKRFTSQDESRDDEPSPSAQDADFDGIIGFFHPFCNAGGGGERVLWAALRATQQRWPRCKCVVYTGDHDVSKDAILSRVQTRFNIRLHAPTITFLYLTTRHLVLASTWPHFTLLGQSIGSVMLVWEAFELLVPDVLIDTMGYAFALGLSKFLFPNILTAAYVHYPTISTDMLQSLHPSDPRTPTRSDSGGLNAGQGVGVRGAAKTVYWRLFARLYGYIGASADVVMTNSSWTQSHIQTLWGPRRLRLRMPHPISVVYPPVAVRELEREVDISVESELRREKIVVYIAQFRPEKNHRLVLDAFALLARSSPSTATSTAARLVFIGSVRDDADSKRVYQLRLLVNELGVRDRVSFHLDASWPEILYWLRRSSVGVNGMWNEHFGIGVVEYQAAGLVAVVHDSGGPKMDIVTDVDGLPTGFHATTADEFARAFEKALSHPNPLEIRQRARKSAIRFSEEEFDRKWVAQMAALLALR